MSYFTVYYGNNESMMFNAECTTGSLVQHMLDVLQPHTCGYEQLELISLPFVLDHFKPLVSSGSSSGGNTGGRGAPLPQQQPSQQSSDCLPVTSKTTAFTGPIPLMGLATRSIESYADALLCSLSTSPSSSFQGVFGASTAANNNNNNTTTGAVAAGVSTASPPSTNCYVLLGCRYFQRRASSFRPAPVTSPSNRMSGVAFRSLCCTNSSAAMEQRAMLIHRAQVVASLASSTMQAQDVALVSGNKAPLSSTTAPPAPVEPSLLLAYHAGVSFGSITNTQWRKEFSRHLSTLLLPPEREGETGPLNTLHTRGEEKMQERPFCVSPPFDKTDSPVSEIMLLPPTATSLFHAPRPPVEAYDVLWCGTRNEHIRLQDALDARIYNILSNNDRKKKKKKA